MTMIHSIIIPIGSKMSFQGMSRHFCFTRGLAFAVIAASVEPLLPGTGGFRKLQASFRGIIKEPINGVKEEFIWQN